MGGADGMGDDEPGRKKLRKRSWETAKLAARLGIAAATKTVGISLPQSDEQAIARAVQLANQFDGMKGLMLKFGQMASYLNTSLPPEAQRILASLQSAATAMPYSQVRDQIQHAFDSPVDEVFDEFVPDAFAAASIGQVHKARCQGRSVAVKVQYPGIQGLIEADMKNIGLFSQLFLMGSKMDATALADELRSRLLEECDYELEAHRQHTIGEVWNQRSGWCVPAVYQDYCRPQVLTSAFENGSRFSDFIQHADDDARRKSSLIIFESVFDGIFHHGFFNGDPHPGNYLFKPDGSVIFLDFGCIKVFERDFMEIWKPLAKAILDNNFPVFKKYFIEMGMVGNAKKFDWDYQWVTIRHLYEPFMSAEPYRFTKAYMSQLYDNILWKNPNRWSLSLPPNQLFVNRLQWGLFSVLADLNAAVVYRDTFRAAVESKIAYIPGLR